MLQQAQNFTESINHEMRTPLGTIILFVQFILNILNSELLHQKQIVQARKYCQIVLGQAEFLKAFVGDLLDLQ